MQCAETGRRRSGRPSRSKISSFKRSGITGKTRSQSPAKAREPVPPVPSPIVLDSPDPSGAEAPHKKKRDVRRTPRPSRTHKKKKRKYSSPSSYESSSSGSSPRFTAAKTALPPFPYPGQGPAAATAPAPAAVALLPKGLTPDEGQAVMLLRAAPLVALPSVTRMLTAPRHGILPRSPGRSAQPQATDDEEVLSEHSGLERLH